MPTNEMAQFAVVSDATGVILRIGAAEIASIPDQAGAGETAIFNPGAVSDDTHYWTGSAFAEYPARPSGDAHWTGAAWVVRPPQPNTFAFWNGTAWVDPRSAGDYADALFEARVAAAIPPRLLMYRLAEAGAYPMDEVANYEFPPTFEEFLSLPGFSTAQHDLIKGGLRSWPTIGRGETRLNGPLHPADPGDGLPYFLPWLATEKSVTITAAQLDAIFEVQLPPPLYTAP